MAEDKLNDPDWTNAKAGAGYGTDSRGTPLKGEPTKRQATKEEAKQLGIETKGMSTREIKAAVEYTREQTRLVAEEMSKFVNTTSQQFATNKKSDDLNATRTPATTTSRITEDKPSKFVVSGSTSPPPKPQSQGGGGGTSQFPPEGWTTLKVAICKDNAEVEATFLAVDPFYEP